MGLFNEISPGHFQLGESCRAVSCFGMDMNCLDMQSLHPAQQFKLSAEGHHSKLRVLRQYKGKKRACHQVGRTIAVYSRVFRLIGADSYTRSFYEVRAFRGEEGLGCQPAFLATVL